MLTAPGTDTRFDDLATPLSQVTFVVLDIETTGTAPEHCAITEIGAVKYRGGEHLGTFDTLVNPGTPIPPFITVLTGITQAMVLPAPRIDEVLPSLLEFIGGAVIVGHNLRFDTSFLDAALLRRGGARLEQRRVDTLGIARRLVRDEVPDLKLGTLARHLRVPGDPCHRALADAQATADVLHALLERAGTLGVLGLDDLLVLPSVRAHPSTDKLRLTASVPRRLGVYCFRDRAGRAVYIGRSANLRQGIRGHFVGDRRKVPQLVREVHTIEWTECTDDLEALVREARLVQQLEPRHNRRGKGWRAYVYLKLTNERFPRLAVVRDVRDDGACYYGPFRSTAAARAIRDAIEAAVPLRRGRERPAQGEADSAAVAQTVRRAFAGEGDLLLDPLRRRIRDLVTAEQFEAAAAARDQIAVVARALRHQQRLDRLRTSGRRQVLTETGVVELENGFLRLAEDPSPISDEPSTDPARRPVDRRQVDELVLVARWIDRAG